MGEMTQSLEISGVLVNENADSIPCKLVHVSEKGYLEIYTLDPVALGSRFQLVIQTPKIRTGLKVTSVRELGDSYHVEALPEESAMSIKAKIVEQKVRGFLK
ncbi:MAG: hypothetical protein D6679_07630 [Candidatus Hydrogenedentota bacterium]|nr:MAG: hypothetical protein D6679_07630 [Candidatus Hydrogenedentota bacterium]